MNTKSLVSFGAVMVCAANLWAGQVLQALTGDGEIQHVSNSSGQGLTKPVFDLPAPPIRAATYAVTGLGRYDDVESKGYLEIMGHFGPRDAYFSRTLAESGPMKARQGSSPWREFRLPFLRNPDMPPPDRLVIHGVLPGNGSVMLFSLILCK